MRRPPTPTSHGGRHRRPTLYHASLAVSAFAWVAAVILAIFLTYDATTGHWINLPLDLIFLALAVGLLLLGRRWHRISR